MIRIEFFLLDYEHIFYIDFPDRLNVGDQIWVDSFLNQFNRGKMSDKNYEIIMSESLFRVTSVIWSKIGNLMIQRAYIENANNITK